MAGQIIKPFFPPSSIDVEASGFSSYSYPIEVGVARSDGRRWCSLIKPLPQWQHWDDEAEAVHGISRAHLYTHGIAPEHVCAELNQFLGDQTVYSDGWVVDYPWLVKLYAACGMHMSFKVSALEYVLSSQQMACWQQTKMALLQEFKEQRHRASSDAYLVQTIYTALAHK